MRLARTLILVLFLTSTQIALSQDTSRKAVSPSLPNPVLVFLGAEPYQVADKSFTRYRYTVENRANYPNELFAAAPDLPPCGQNANASRSWVDLYDQTGQRLYGFCSLGGSDGLNQLWFSMADDIVPPSWIYIEINDRKAGVKYKSNLAETTL